MERNFIYTALIVSVYDGDTVTAEVDLGFNVKMEMKLRLLGIDTPEIRGEEKEKGIEVRDYVRNLILNKKVIFESFKDKAGKYGRYLAIIHVPTEDGETLNLNDHLLLEGMAEEYK